MSFPYKALREKPGLVSPEGDGMPTGTREKNKQAHEKQRIFMPGMAYA